MLKQSNRKGRKAAAKELILKEILREIKFKNTFQCKIRASFFFCSYASNSVFHFTENRIIHNYFVILFCAKKMYWKLYQMIRQDSFNLGQQLAMRILFVFFLIVTATKVFFTLATNF